jgi:hypothetical protein
MPTNRYPHLFLEGPSGSQPFTSPQQGGGKPKVKQQDPHTHAAFIEQRLKTAWDEAKSRQSAAHSTRAGIYLDFFSEPGFDLALKSLDVRRSKIRLLSVKTHDNGDDAGVTRATVYIPKSQSQFFLKKVHEYATEVNSQSKDEKPKNARLINSIGDIKATILESFWQDELSRLPDETPEWVEAWLSSEDLIISELFAVICQQLSIERGEGTLSFPERVVCLIRASRRQLQDLIELFDHIAEFRAAREVAAFFTSQDNNEQTQWIESLLDRCRYREHDRVAVLILDHGVNNGHKLLKPLLADNDCHTVDAAWSVSDHDGHGTLMAGTVAYGDLVELLQGNSEVWITHSLESAKILPPPPAINPKHLWGYRTSQGISLAEIQAPQRQRIICMAVASDDQTGRGRPSSWSGLIDELCSGYSDDTQRLIILSAGNVNDPQDWKTYPDSNKTVEVQDPAQSWNAVTVGAYTTKTLIRDTTLAGYKAVASVGSLSPFSCTSCTWPPRMWPIKPEILLEGGNVANTPTGSTLRSDDLELLSTFRDPQIAQFGTFNATSAAAAQGAWLAAKIQSAYPTAWPETIRALMVHSAEWTDAQRSSFLTGTNKAAYAKLARICGYGVPNLEQALYCASNSLTLIAQTTIQPFDKDQKNGRYISKEMHLYRLPWPRDVLLELGETPVHMRVTLSYFIEPSPGQVGWKDRYRYASHGLRFELNRPGENESQFVKRVNRKARDDEDSSESSTSESHWTLGAARDVGSIHSDIWEGNAAELASSNLVAIHPAVGWWRERHYLGRWQKETRYSLIVSIRLPSETIDIYTPIAVQLGVQTPILITVPVI